MYKHLKKLPENRNYRMLVLYFDKPILQIKQNSIATTSKKN